MLSFLTLAAVVAVAVNGAAIAEDTNCSHDGQVYKDGDLFRFFSYSNCVIMRCDKGKAVEVRGECTDSYGRCHRDGDTWDQGCKSYRCEVRTTVDEDNYTWTAYTPVKIRDC